MSKLTLFYHSSLFLIIIVNAFSRGKLGFFFGMKNYSPALMQTAAKTTRQSKIVNFILRENLFCVFKRIFLFNVDCLKFNLKLSSLLTDYHILFTFKSLHSPKNLMKTNWDWETFSSLWILSCLLSFLLIYKLFFRVQK